MFAGSRKISYGDSSVLFGLKMAKRPQQTLAIFGGGCGSRIAAARHHPRGIDELVTRIMAWFLSQPMKLTWVATRGS
jgi:hypothetical protein